MSGPKQWIAKLRALDRRTAGVCAGVAAALIFAAVKFLPLHAWVNTDDAYVEGTMSFLAAEVSGRVLEVAVDEHQRVKQGDVLVRLDPADAEARLAKARADLDAARNSMRAAQASSSSAKAQLEATKVELWRAGRELERAEQLFTENAVSRQRLDEAKAARDGAEAQARSLELRAQAESAMLGDDAPERQAEAALHSAELALEHTVIRAPFDGFVGRKNVDPGTIVAPGQALLALAGSGQSWVIANFKETQIRDMAVGNRAEITIDAFPGFVWSGHVDSFSPATGAKYALIPAEPAAGNFTRVVQRVPVKIILDSVSGEGAAAQAAPIPKDGDALPVGLSARVSVAGR